MIKIYCHAELVSASSVQGTGSRNKFGMTTLYTKQGQDGEEGSVL